MIRVLGNVRIPFGNDASLSLGTRTDWVSGNKNKYIWPELVKRCSDISCDIWREQLAQNKLISGMHGQLMPDQCGARNSFQ